MTLDPKALEKAEYNFYHRDGTIRNAILAYLSARAEQGFVEAPREPTEVMLRASNRCHEARGNSNFNGTARAAYRAMLSAAQPQETDHDVG